MKNKGLIFSTFCSLLVVLSVILAPVVISARTVEQSGSSEQEVEKSNAGRSGSEEGEKGEISGSTRVESEDDNKVEYKGAPATTQYLSAAMQELYNGSVGKMSYNDAAFCDALATSILNLSAEAKSTLAWNKTSYASSTGLQIKGDDDKKAIVQKVKDVYTDINTKIDGLTNKEGLDRGQVYVFNAEKAIVRSFMIDSFTSFKGDQDGTARVNKMSSLGYGALICLEKNISDTSKADLDTIKSSFVKLTVGTTDDGDDSEDKGKEDKNKNRVTHKDIESEDEDNSSNDGISLPAVAPVKDSVKVSDEDTFKSFSKNLMRDDKAIREVSFDDSNVSFTYAQRAKLLGFIPMWQNNKVTSTNAGEVKIIKPWYSFLTKEPVKVSETDLLEKLNDNKLFKVGEDGTVPEEVTASLVKKYSVSAKILEVLTNVFKTKTDAGAIDPNAQATF